MSSRTRALLKFGLWPDLPMPGRPASSREPVELTAAAREQGLRAIEELARLGVVVMLDNGKARFRSSRVVMPAAARRIVEKWGDVIAAALIESVRTLETTERGPWEAYTTNTKT